MQSNKKHEVSKIKIYFILLLSFGFSLPSIAQEYIEFVANPGWDTEFTGNFNSWEFTQFSMPDNDPSQLEATLKIDLTDISAFTEQIADLLQEKDYFDTEKYPAAQMLIKQVTPINENTFDAQVELTLKGTTQVLPLQFEKSDTDFVKGTVSLNRMDFGVVGDGPAEEVQIRFEVQLPKN